MSSPNLPALSIQSLRKSYGRVQALQGLDLEVGHGEIFGFLGPNGAGKTTTIRCLLDLIRPDGGTIRVLGLDPPAQPVGRTALFFGRLAAFLLAAVSIMVIGWLGFSVTLGSTSLDVTWGQMALPFVSLLVQVLVYGALALLLSMLLPSRRLAARTAGLVLVASYFLTWLSRINKDLHFVARFLPHDYYQGGKAVAGLNLTWLFGLLAASAVLALLAWVLFLRRDIRVSGEGGWRLEWFTNKRIGGGGQP